MEINLNPTGPFRSEFAKTQANATRHLGIDFIDVKASASVNDGATSAGFRLTYLISNSSSQTIEIKNPVSGIGFTITDKETGAVVSPSSPASRQSHGTTSDLDMELARKDISFLVSGHKARAGSEVLSLAPKSVTEFVIVIPNALTHNVGRKHNTMMNPKSTNTITFPNPEMQAGKMTAIPFKRIHGVYSVVSSIGITLNEDPDISYIMLFDADLKL